MSEPSQPPSLTLPLSLQGVELVKSVRTPAELRYEYTPGAATTRFLTGIGQKKILGERCPVCGKVYVPPRGSARRTAYPPASRSTCRTRGRSRRSAS